MEEYGFYIISGLLIFISFQLARINSSVRGFWENNLMSLNLIFDSLHDSHLNTSRLERLEDINELLTQVHQDLIEIESNTNR